MYAEKDHEKHHNRRDFLKNVTGSTVGLFVWSLASDGYVNAAQPTPEEIDLQKSLWWTRDPAEYAKRAWGIRQIMAADPLRPIYHFLAPLGFTCDPNGPLYYQGEYHLFFQFNPRLREGSSKFDGLCWGHAKSKDLVHWQDLPIAMRPDTPYDRNGVCSGNTVINDDGVPTAIYTGKIVDQAETYTMMATSTDGLINWKKRMVIDKPPYPGTPVNWDSQVWKDGSGWYLLTGGRSGERGAALLWSSPNLIDWTFRKVIYSTSRYGGYWEFPYLIPLGGKYVLLVGSDGVKYWLGSYNKEEFVFTPDSPEAEVLDPGRIYGTNVHMLDTHGPGGTPRRLLFGWVTGGTTTRTVPSWNGLTSLPRVLTLENGRLVQRPIPELEVLRGRHVHLEDKLVDNPAPGLLKDFNGDALEIIADFEPNGVTAKRFGLKLLMSDDEKQYALAYYDVGSGDFGTDGTIQGGKHQTSAHLLPGQSVRMHIFVDRSVLEFFVGGRTVTERYYPDHRGQRLDLFAEGGKVALASLDIWNMDTCWKEPG
jgi:beta-fructofuranosidase